jgi:hypothetical protein
MSRYSSTTFSIHCCCAKDPYLEVVATVFLFPSGWIIIKKKILVFEMILQQCFILSKEIAKGGGTSGILYNLFLKVIIIV